MKYSRIYLLFVFLFSSSLLFAQVQLPEFADKAIVTEHEVSINGQKIPYSATTGFQPVFGDDERTPIATLHYTYYKRTDIKDDSRRPLMISFNGGPGSASVWMHLAYTGPKVLVIDDEGFPIQPYGVKDNPHSVLDIADIVFVNPVNTGYSRILDEEVDRDTFFGVNQDIEYLADWINLFVTRMNRWRSPKYLIGESYGTTRVSGLALELQNSEWMYLNGVILVSPTELGVHTSERRRDGPLGASLRLPYFTAAAWYHNKLPAELQALDLEEVLPLAEEYAINELMPILVKGGFVDDQVRLEAAKQMARFSGISEEAILQYNLDVPTAFYWKELLRDEGNTVGRLDSRYKGLDRTRGGESPDFNSELTSWLHSFTPAVNYYFLNHLDFQTDLKYNMFGPVRPWDRTGNNSGENLRQAMAQNPYLHTLVQSGYYDGATKYFDAMYTMWQLDPSGEMKDRFSFKGYRSGHMMYLRAEDLKNANDDIREFIQNSIPLEGTPAKY
ncbi:MAG: carboxypeptidase [Balneola sp.]|nr:MAG: carboxypeptidase [Balneola sp.]